MKKNHTIWTFTKMDTRLTSPQHPTPRALLSAPRPPPPNTPPPLHPQSHPRQGPQWIEKRVDPEARGRRLTARAGDSRGWPDLSWKVSLSIPSPRLPQSLLAVCLASHPPSVPIDVSSEQLPSTSCRPPPPEEQLTKVASIRVSTAQEKWGK